MGLVSACSIHGPRGRRGIRGTWSHGVDGCRRRSPIVIGGVSWPQPGRCGHIVPGCMGSSEVEGLAVASGKRGNDLCCQWHLAHCHMCDDAILYSGSMDGAFALYTRGLYFDVPAATSYIAEAFCICDSHWYDDPRGYIVDCAADARFSDRTARKIIMDWRNRKRLLATNLFLFALLFMLVTLNKEYVRPEFSHIPFLGVLTGSLPNFIAACIISLAVVNAVVSRKPKHGRLIVYICSSLVFLVLAIEEFRPMWGASTQYDPFDILASGAGSLTAVLTYELIVMSRKDTRMRKEI